MTAWAVVSDLPRRHTLGAQEQTLPHSPDKEILNHQLQLKHIFICVYIKSLSTYHTHALHINIYLLKKYKNTHNVSKPTETPHVSYIALCRLSLKMFCLLFSLSPKAGNSISVEIKKTENGGEVDPSKATRTWRTTCARVRQALAHSLYYKRLCLWSGASEASFTLRWRKGSHLLQRHGWLYLRWQSPGFIRN